MRRGILRARYTKGMHRHTQLTYVMASRDSPLVAAGRQERARNNSPLFAAGISSSFFYQIKPPLPTHYQPQGTAVLLIMSQQRRRRQWRKITDGKAKQNAARRPTLACSSCSGKVSSIFFFIFV